MSEMETQLEECGVCHALHPYNELSCFDDTLICPDCLEDSTVVCGRCGERLWRDDDQGNEDSGHLCQSCYDRYYNTCERCHRIISEEDAYYEDDDTVLCYDCHRHHRSRYSINDYSYKPDPIFYGSDTLYMGIEIELDEGGESDNQARKLLEIANQDSEKIYCKHDGSLKVKLDCGEILKIDAEGNMTRSQFDDTNIFMGYSHWPRWPVQPECWKPAANDSYINDLKSIAAYYGIWPEDIDEMLADGVTPEEIEDLLNGA